MTGRSRSPRLVLEPVQHPVAVDLGHHHVEQHQVEAGRLEAGDRLLAVLRDAISV